MGYSVHPGGGCEVCVVRPTLSITERASKYHYTPQHNPGFFESLQIQAKESCSCSARWIMSVLAARVPILSWLPAYNLRSTLVGDIVSGITVAIMHIPQGMGFALLAELPPIIGIYMAFFPVLIYAVLGTSRHSSMGAFAIICLMTGKVVKQLAVIPDPESPHDGNETQPILQGTHTYTPVQVAALVALMNGIVQVGMGVLQVGSLCVFLSDMLVSGFTTGAALHVLTSQIPFLLGIHVRTFQGPLKIIYAYIDIIGQMFSCDSAVMIISLITIIVLIFSNEYVKPWFRTFTKIPIPVELIVVISGTLTSYLDNFHDVYNIRIVGEVPTGLPKPTLPPVELMSTVLVDSVVISVVAYVVSFSMARIFAKRHNYNVDANQELYAMGASNVFGSFFGCAPIAVSLARSLIQEAAGGKTQITSFVCCFLLLFVLLFIGPVFETLPNCVLSSIIVVALKGMFMQVRDLKRVWGVSRPDAMIWLASFLGVVIIDIDYGLLLGIVTSLLVLLYRSQQPRTARLGRVPNTDVYLNVKAYSVALEVPKISIFQFTGPLHFANTDYFRQQVMSVSGLNPAALVDTKLLEEKRRHPEAGVTSQQTKDVEYLVVEMSAVSYTDSSGGNLLSQLSKEYQEAGITVCLAALSESVLQTLDACGTLNVIPAENIFHSVHDAVVALTHLDPTLGVHDVCTQL